jgi:flavin reductase (DIM6/NTAB) family NADH-FMN oxidoreductase RutF
MTIGHEFSMPPLLSGLDYMARATHHIIIITTISSGNVLPLKLYFSFCLRPAPVVPGPPKRKRKTEKKRVSSSFKIKILFYFARRWIFSLVGKAKENNKTTR